MENKYAIKEVMDLIVYDEEGNFITKLDTLNNSAIYIDAIMGEAFLIARDALMDMELLRFVYGDMHKNLSDFDSFIDHITNKKIVFNNRKLKKSCKLIATSVIRNLHTLEDEAVYYEIPNAEISSPFFMGSKEEEIKMFDLRFIIKASEHGDLFCLHV